MQARLLKSLFFIFLFSFLGYIFYEQKNDVLRTEFTTIDGEKLSLINFQGKPVVVTFWATDCPSCLKEIPIWLDLYERYHWKGLEIIAINMYYDPPNRIVEFSKRERLPYKVVLDTQRLLASVFKDVKISPTTFLLDGNGRIIWQTVGLFDPSELELKIQAFLNIS